MSAEEWRWVPGYDSYQVSSEGRVRSVPHVANGRWGEHVWKRARVLSPFPKANGYLAVGLSGGNARSRKERTVHSLVAEAFIGPRPPGLQVCHSNGVKTDNRLSNLRYDTPKANARDRDAHRLARMGASNVA